MNLLSFLEHCEENDVRVEMLYVPGNCFDAGLKVRLQRDDYVLCRLFTEDNLMLFKTSAAFQECLDDLLDKFLSEAPEKRFDSVNYIYVKENEK